MAAHDDKISTNRRRLFKALSAAPVVATLSPGEALANSSAYQCLYNELNARGFHRQETPECASGDECYGYGEHSYYDFVNDGQSVEKRGLPAELQGIVVEIEGRYWNESNKDVTDWVRKESDGTLTGFTSTNRDRRCKKLVPEKKGLALQLVETLDENFIPVDPASGRAVNVRLKGPYPKHKLNHGYNQGITRSCLNSFGGMPSHWKIHRG